MSSISESTILCHGCQTEFPKMKKCSGCLNVHYCSVTCQFKHWPEHKSSCDPQGTNEECPICYYVIHSTTKELPKLSCKTCHYKFHSIIFTF